MIGCLGNFSFYGEFLFDFEENAVATGYSFFKGLPERKSSIPSRAGILAFHFG